MGGRARWWAACLTPPVHVIPDFLVAPVEHYTDYWERLDLPATDTDQLSHVGTWQL